MATVNYQGNGLPDQLPGISDYSMMAIGDYRPANQEAQYRINNARNGFLQNLAAQEEAMKFNEWKNQAGLREAQNQEQLSKAQIGNLDNLTRIATNPQDRQLAIQKALSALPQEQQESIKKQQAWLATNGKPYIDELNNNPDAGARQMAWRQLKQAVGDTSMPDRYTPQAHQRLMQIYAHAVQESKTAHANKMEEILAPAELRASVDYDQMASAERIAKIGADAKVVVGNKPIEKKDFVTPQGENVSLWIYPDGRTEIHGKGELATPEQSKDAREELQKLEPLAKQYKEIVLAGAKVDAWQQASKSGDPLPDSAKPTEAESRLARERGKAEFRKMKSEVETFWRKQRQHKTTPAPAYSAPNPTGQWKVEVE